MSHRVFDTSVLITVWNHKTSGAVGLAASSAVKGWAHETITIHNTDRILTPVVIEFIAGVQSRRELTLAEDFLDEFRIFDEGRIQDVDWHTAKQIARRIPSDGKRRHFGDCLIRAIAKRLKCDVVTFDARFPK